MHSFQNLLNHRSSSKDHIAYDPLKVIELQYQLLLDLLLANYVLNA